MAATVDIIVRGLSVIDYFVCQLVTHSLSFTVKHFFSGQDEFKVSTFAKREGGSAAFPLHYDLPVTKYEANQKPWLYDFLLS